MRLLALQAVGEMASIVVLSLFRRAEAEAGLRLLEHEIPGLEAWGELQWDFYGVPPSGRSCKVDLVPTWSRRETC